MMFRRCLTASLAGLLILAGLAMVPTASALPAATAAADDAESSYARTMLVLDSSGSMGEPAAGGGTKIAAAKSALRDVVQGLPVEAEVGLRVFGAEVFSRDQKGACTDSQRVVDPGTDNRGELVSAIGRYKPFGETPIPHALQEAAKDLGGEGDRSIVLVSDGESTCDPDPCVVAGQLAQDGIDLTIDVVGLSVSGEARRQLQCIADRGNGTYYDADSAQDIEANLSRAAQRALRPFTLDGEPIKGGPEDDPTEVTVGDWIDTLGVEGSDTGSRSYLFERTTEGSTLRVSAATQGSATNREGLDISIVGPDGEECDTGRAIRQFDSRRIVGVQAVASDEEEETCAQPGDYTITVTRVLADQEKVPFGLRVAEEPPLVDPLAEEDADAKVAPPQASGKPTEVVGGASFGNAAEIGPGRWSSTVVPGEALMYRLPLEFGQAARISVSYPRGTPAMQEALDSSIGALGNIVTYNPMHAQMSYPDGAEFSGRSGGDAPLTLLTATPPLARNLTDYGGYNGSEDYSTSGAYYLGVSIEREENTVEIPFTIDVEILGEPTEGPAYVDGATWTVADGASGGEVEEETPSEEPSESSAPPEEDAPPAAADDDEAGGLQLAAGVGAGLLGLVAIGAALLMWRRRRTG